MFVEHDINKTKNKTATIQHSKHDFKDVKWHPEGKRIINQLICQLQPPKPKNRVSSPLNRDQVDNHTFRELLSRRDRHKQSQTKLEIRQIKKNAEDFKYETNHNKSASKSKSKSKGINKSKSLKQLVKKDKSMTRLQARPKVQIKVQKRHKEQRKSDSPQQQGKSTISYAQRKNYKSHYNSKTTREMVSQLTTSREKSKAKMKISQVSKPSTKKTKKLEDTKRKFSKPIATKKTEKENSKIPKKTMSKDKKFKDKHVITSGHAKIKKDLGEDWNSSLQEEFLNPKLHNKSSQETNMVVVPKRKERLSLNSNSNKKHLLIKNNKTEAQIQNCKSRVREIQNLAATAIQKVFRGYITRKYIRQCFEHNAAVNIQRVWRGYRVRRQLRRSKLFTEQLPQPSSKIEQDPRERKLKNLNMEEYLLQNSRQSDFKSRNVANEPWATIFHEILSEETINQNIKKKIEIFLESQRKDTIDFQFRSNPSNSARSSISSQVINNQMTSERNFLALERKKKELQAHMPAYISPAGYRSPKSLGFGSPKIAMMNSPVNYFPDRIIQHQPERASSELLIQNLKSIQKFHKQRLNYKANTQKQELNSMLLKNKLSPRTHEKKYKEVQQCLESELEKFNQSINQIVKNCILYKDESPQQSFQVIQGKGVSDILTNLHQDNLMITPKKQMAPLELPELLQESCSPKLKAKQPFNSFQYKYEQRSAELGEYYHSQKAQLTNNNNQYASFDSSYQFIEQYLISLIEYLRQYDSGSYISHILSCLRKPRSHQTQTILRNLQPFTEEGSQDSQMDNCFHLPMYKFLQLDEEIIEPTVIDSYNSTFFKLQNRISTGENLQEHFIKMIGDCMNEALNSLRPTSYIFNSTHLSTINALKAMQKVVVYQPDTNSEEQMQYQFMLAQALNKIFYWNKLQMGKALANLSQEDDSPEMRQYLIKQMEDIIKQIQIKDPWDSYEEQVELIGLLSDGLFDIILCEEMAQIWTLINEWNHKNCKGNLPNLKLESGSPKM